MRNKTWLCTLIVGVLTFLVAASFASATSLPVRGGSNYGVQTTNFTDCWENFNTTTFPNGCMVFGASIGSVNFSSLGLNTSFSVVQFAADGHLFDVVDLGPLSSGTVFTLSTSLFNPATGEVFSCNAQGGGSSDVLNNTSQTSITDSNGHGLPGSSPCTQGLGPTNIDLVGYDSGTGKFTLNQGLPSGDLVLDFTPGSVPAPEPTSLLLLGTGLFAVGIARRNKKTGTSKA